MKSILDLIHVVDGVIEFHGLSTGRLLAAARRRRTGGLRRLRGEIQSARRPEERHLRRRGCGDQSVDRLRAAVIRLLVADVHLLAVLTEEIRCLSVGARRGGDREIVGRARRMPAADGDRFRA